MLVSNVATIEQTISSLNTWKNKRGKALFLLALNDLKWAMLLPEVPLTLDF